ncbi:MAG: thiamine pyrophosphate-dependent dehydrogenase E1 component subunit alpha [Candidatus Omnitrophota bacterium]|nr:thiamine pyrophosphate-dependent dehydrogenase E1 component subunit alpha [Candidatus Omnitrophota bacterium]
MSRLSAKNAIQFYHKILLIRKCEDRICSEYATDEIKTPVHLHIGAEAIAVGVIAALGSSPQVFGTYRNHAHYLMLTGDTDTFFAELYGKVTGCAHGKAGSMHLTAPERGLLLTSAVVATTIPVAVGAAFANVYQNKKNVVASFFGDGAMEEGAFWESINFASLHKLPVLFVCEDNNLAIHTGKKERQGFRSAKDAVAGFECHYGEAPGHRVDLIHEAATGLLAKMAKDGKPGFLKCEYHRFRSHVGVRLDYAAGYRPKPSAAELEAVDPVLAAKDWVLGLGAKEAALEKIAADIDKEIDASVAKARTDAFPGIDDLYTGVLS